MKTLALTGVIAAIAAITLALTPVNQCGTVLHPDSTRSTAPCDAPLATQWDAVWALGVIAVAHLTAWQIVNWQRRKQS